MATYQSERFLQKAIDSVVAQDYKNIEHIIIDGGSTDSTCDIIEKNKKNISKYVSEKDKGIYDAFNKGVNAATGDIIAFLNSDDFYVSSDVITKIVNIFVEQDADAVYSDLEYVSQNNVNKTIRTWKSGEWSPEFLSKGWMPPHPTFFLKRKIYIKHQIEDKVFFNISYKIAADYDFMIRVLKDKNLKVVYLPVCTVKMRSGGASNRSLKNIIQKLREDYAVIRRNKIGNIFTLLNKNFSKISQLFQ